MPKRLQFLQELVPTVKTCAVLINPRSPGVERSTRAALQGAADGLGLALEIVSARTESEFEAAFARIAALKAEALLVTTDPLFTGRPGHLVGLAARYAVPTSYPWREFVLIGGLISYGPSLTEAYRQVGIYAGKILDGQNPADLPVMQPTTFELVVNLKTATGPLGAAIDPRSGRRGDRILKMAIAAILRRDHHWSGNFLQDAGEEIYRNVTEGSKPACSSCESENFRSRARVRAGLDRGAQSDRAWPHLSRRHAAHRARAASASSTPRRVRWNS